MRASLRSVRIAPKKLSVIAQMVRGMPVTEALDALQHTHKKAARIIETLLKSAVANATFNDKQSAHDLVLKTIVVNQAQSYRRGVPMARGRMRPMRKFLSHLDIILGLQADDVEKVKDTKKIENASQAPKKPVQRSVSSAKKAKKS